jgi:hypothetical protein
LAACDRWSFRPVAILESGIARPRKSPGDGRRRNPAGTASSVPINLGGSGRLSMSGILYAAKAAIDITGAGGLTVNSDLVYGRAEAVVSDLKDTGSGRVAINVDSPTVTIRMPTTTVVPGQPVPLVIGVLDTSALAELSSFTYTVSFGDGDRRVRLHERGGDGNHQGRAGGRRDRPIQLKADGPVRRRHEW